MLHFDTRFGIYSGPPREKPSLARELREFARELQHKAQSEALPKTLAAARELEKIARRGLEAESAEDALKRELGEFRKKLAAQASSAGRDPSALPTSRRELADLRTELETARESFEAGDSETQALQERLAGLTQLKKQADAQPGGSRQLSRGEMKALVDKLEKDVTGELDRRALAEAQESLKALTQGERGRLDPRGRARGDEEKKDGRAERWDENIPGNSPGTAPGEKGGAPSLPESQGARATHVKGPIGEGERSSTFFKAMPQPGKSRLSREEIITSYQRQAEAELATERIPEDLRDTIKNYFLSLEQTK
jgi:hypothetical protein